MRSCWLLPLALVGCKYGFSDAPDAASIAAPVDTTDAPLPHLVCSATRVVLDPQLGPADVAITPTSGGFAVAWASRSGGPLYAARLDDMRRITAGPAMVTAGPVDGVAGIADIGNLYSLVSTRGGEQTLWSLERDLRDPVARRTEAVIASRDPISPGGGARALFRGAGTQLVTSYVRADGTLGSDTRFDLQNPVGAVCGDEGAFHGHIVWMESAATYSRCVASDVDYSDPLGPRITGGRLVSDDCYEPRNANGPYTTDTMYIAWRTKNREVRVQHITGGATTEATLSLGGRAPRVRFDEQAHAWIAWIEEQPSPQLHIASMALDGTVERSALTGFVPSSDEAFEIVRAGSWTYLALIDADGGLDVLTLCR